MDTVEGDCVEGEEEDGGRGGCEGGEEVRDGCMGGE